MTPSASHSDRAASECRRWVSTTSARASKSSAAARARLPGGQPAGGAEGSVRLVQRFVEVARHGLGGPGGLGLRFVVDHGLAGHVGAFVVQVHQPVRAVLFYQLPDGRGPWLLGRGGLSPDRLDGKRPVEVGAGVCLAGRTAGALASGSKTTWPAVISPACSMRRSAARSAAGSSP